MNKHMSLQFWVVKESLIADSAQILSQGLSFSMSQSVFSQRALVAEYLRTIRIVAFEQLLLYFILTFLPRIWIFVGPLEPIFLLPRSPPDFSNYIPLTFLIATTCSCWLLFFILHDIWRSVSLTEVIDADIFEIPNSVRPLSWDMSKKVTSLREFLIETDSILAAFFGFVFLLSEKEPSQEILGIFLRFAVWIVITWHF